MVVYKQLIVLPQGLRDYLWHPHGGQRLFATVKKVKFHRKLELCHSTRRSTLGKRRGGPEAEMRTHRNFYSLQ